MLNDTFLSGFTKTYTGKTYLHTAAIRHKGMVIAFAMDNQRRIWYAALNSNPTAGAGSPAPSPLDVNNWPAGPSELLFPNEIAETGFGVAGQTMLPVFQKGNRTPVAPGIRLDRRDRDSFLSGTARFTAAAPFQVLTDGSNIYLFRQAIGTGHADMVWTDKAGHRITSSDGTRANMVWADEKGVHKVFVVKNNQLELDQPQFGEPTPLVNSTLLVDRFVLVGAELQSRLEVRFQRSRSKTRPQSRKDSLGAKDLDGNYFYEPTQELRFVGNLTAGRFSVLLLPTSVSGVERWQIFAQNANTGRLDSFNVERGADGLFNTRGSQEGNAERHAESALHLEKSGDFVSLNPGATLGAQYTQEAWIFPGKTQSVTPQALFSGDTADKNGAPSVWIEAQTRLRVGFGDGQQWQEFTSRSILTPNAWNHLAVTFDGKAFRFYIGGTLREKIELPAAKQPAGNPVRFLGAAQNGFTGIVDEIRFWNRARSAAELKADMSHRLTGLEPGLIGYWRFDEGDGNTVFDQTNNGADGILTGGAWVNSDAPVGENPGINRSSFLVVERGADGKIEPRQAASGMTALLYFQQANVASGYDGKEKPLKQNARVMLALATKTSAADGKPHIAALDFGVSASGRIAQVPDNTVLTMLNTTDAGGTSINQKLDKTGALQNEIRLLELDIDRTATKIGALPAVIQVLAAALDHPESFINEIADKNFKHLNSSLNALKQSAAALNSVLLQKQQMENIQAAARVTVFEHSGFSGKSMSLGTGFVGASTLGAAGLQDAITSLRIDSPLQVTAYEDSNRGGESILFNESASNVGGDWNDRISSMDIGVQPAFSTGLTVISTAVTQAQQLFDQAKAVVQDELATLQARISPLQLEKSAKETRLADARFELGSLQSDLKNGVSVTMPLVHLDPFGLSVSGGLLGFAWTNDAPLLFDSATGSLALYFRGDDDQFFATYFNTFTEKAKYPLADAFGNDSVLAVARSNDLDMDKLVLELSGAENTAFCTLRIEGAGIRETWSKLPRNPVALARVLNGEAGHYSNNKLVGYREFIGFGTVANEAGQLTLEVPDGIRRALEPEATLMLGDTRVTVQQAAASQATKVFITSGQAPVFPGSKAPVFFMEYDYAANATTTKIPGDLFGGSLLLRAVSLSGARPVANQRVTGGSTITSAWVANAPGSTLAFDGKTVFAKAPEPTDLSRFDIKDDVTLEAWVRPNRVEEKARIIHHRSGNSNYTLGLLQRDLNSALELDGSSCVDLNSGVVPGREFTLEAWILSTAKDSGFHGIVGNQPGPPAGRSPSMWVTEKTKLHAGFGDGADWHSFITDSVLVPGEWNHVAFAFDGANSRIFVNGLQVFQTDALKGKVPAAVPVRFIGKVDNFFKGKIDEVRCWKRARTQQEVNSDMNHRLAGNETDLVGYWHFDNKTARDYSRNNNNGVLLGNAVQALSPLPAYAVYAGVNGKYVETKDALPAGLWTHLAVAFVQRYGLQFDGISGYLDCGNDDSLNINTDLTIEVFFQNGIGSRSQGILARGVWSDGSQPNVPYALAIDESRRLVFSFEDEDGNPHSFISNAELADGKLHRVAVTRKQQTLSYRMTSLPRNSPYSFGWHDIVMYIDQNAPEIFVYAINDNAAEAIALARIPEDSAAADRDVRINNLVGGNIEQKTKTIGRSDKPLIVGRTDQFGYFRGIISELRIWNKNLDGANVLKPILGNEDGLVSWWRFEEREGNRASDSKSRNHATINGNVQWTKDPELTSSGLAIFVNEGNPLATNARNAADFGAGAQNFSLGALPDGSELFQGELEELRVWKNVRTEEQIQDNLFRRLNSELDQLIAYYTFDAEKNNQLNDNALRGNNLAVQGQANYLLSTAPISDDAPQVRSALAGIRTPFSGFIHSTPAVQEYGDMQFDAQGNLIGVFKRCYGLIKNGDWQLITGFKVGDLVAEWIGQVQFAPRLMGFIEGAPPVPSENLTQPSVEMIGDLDDYNEASKIELMEATETTYTYSSSKEQSFGLEVDLALKFGIKSESDFGAGIGAFTITKVEESKAMVGVRTHFEAMWGWSEEAGAGVGRNAGKTTGMELRGRYTSPEENENEPFGRRFVPDNTGLALVQSETADVFALRLRHNNALISFSMRPNPDIPKDWNIISFPINSQYTKQGTLDGKIGPMVDPDYPNAFEYSADSSYFKPVEAYALKNKIKREETELETYYRQFDAQGKGQKAYFPSDSALDLAEYSELKKILHRNIVNTYVWTSDGGLFAETQQNKEMLTESTSGKYEFTGAVGLELSVGFHILKVGAIFELSAMFIGQHQLSVSKSKDSETSFELNVSVDKVERDIYKRDERKVVVTDKSDPLHPKPVKNPFKVDAYRFMTFYLEQHSDHFGSFFNSVVDPLWLEQSSDPSASALREARQSATSCWRVMHRVTYVSRVLPPLDRSAPPSLEKALQTLDIDSNYELIRQLEPYVSNRLGSFPDFTDAVRDTIEQHLPELRPHTEEVIRYMSHYFGIVDGQMPNAERFGENTLLELAPNQPPIVNAGLDQIIGLDGASVSADLEAVVIDDRLEKAEAIFVSWEKLEGEGDVLFENLHAAKTKATFTKRGRYILRLQASDGMLSADDTLVVIVDERPVISAGSDQEVFARLDENGNNILETLLTGVIINDGLGDGEAGKSRLSVNWSLLRPQGDAPFADKNALITKTTFQSSGHFLLQLSVSNSTFTATDEILVAVAARTTKQLQALYTFEENGGGIVHDVSGAGAALDLQIADAAAVEWLKGGLKLKSPALLISQGAATRLHEAVKASNELTVEAWIKPALVRAEGLARILTLSGGPAARNVLLGQSGDQFHVGLRSSTSNINASDKALTGGTVDTEKPVHIVCTRNAEGLLRVYAGGKEVASRNVNGDFANWANDFQLALGNETGTADGIDRAWLGTYHLVALYSRALSEQEVLQNFRFGADENLPPIVSAGSDVVVNWPEFNWPANSAQKKIITLDGRVTHDRATAGSIRWTQAGGPTEGVKILNDQSPQTQVELTQKGRYVFRLTADDGKLLSSNEVAITVHCRPDVEIISGTQHVALSAATAETALEAVIRDSGLGDDNGSSVPTIKWSLISGPASLQLTGATALKARATSTERGLYGLRLEVDNGNVKTNIPLTLTVDQKPVVSIAPLPVITLPANEVNPLVTLDTGLGNPSESLHIGWEKASGPEGGAVVFSQPDQVSSAATFSKGGVYRLRLTAANLHHPDFVAVAERVLVVNVAPAISIGTPPEPLLLKTGQGNVAVRLDATVSDDGLPDPPGVVALKWSKISGPANVSFTPDDTDYTEVKFTQKGKYVLQLEADDQAAKTAVPVTVVVNTAPVVDAGPQQKVTVEGSDLSVSLKGVISDKGLGDETPQSRLNIQWEKQSGPAGSAEPAIAGADTLEPTVQLPKVKGTYVFKMTVNNGFDSSTDTVAVIVHVPPVVSVDVFGAEPPHPRKRQLSIQVQDNGLGNPQQGALTFAWKKTIGQEPVTFQPDPNNELISTVTFPKSGSYTLELAVGNGSGFTVKKTVTVTVA